MADEPKKISVRCPHCGGTQQEPRHVMSTYCRGCGQHFKVGPSKAQPEPQAATPGFMTRIVRSVVQKPPRKVRCYTCDTVHEASGYASSTICPSCSAYIDLKNIVISNRTTRVVDTRGHLHIQKGGFLNNVSTICGSALIEGQLNGNLYCDGPVRIACQGRCSTEFSATKIVVEKGADVYVTSAIRAVEVVIRGKIAGRILCSGSVKVFKHGFLEGDVHARAITVDKGGTYQGNIYIGKFEQPQPPKNHPGSKKAFTGPDGLPSESQAEFPIQ